MYINVPMRHNEAYAVLRDARQRCTMAERMLANPLIDEQERRFYRAQLETYGPVRRAMQVALTVRKGRGRA